MCASRRSAVWPQLVAISLIGLGAASCSSDSGRFSDIFGSNSSSRSDTTGSIPQGTSTSRVESRSMPHLASSDPEGSSGGGRGMGSYQPGNSEITGSLPAATPPPTPPLPPPSSAPCPNIGGLSLVSAMYRSRAATKISADRPSGKGVGQPGYFFSNR